MSVVAEARVVSQPLNPTAAPALTCSFIFVFDDLFSDSPTLVDHLGNLFRATARLAITFSGWEGGGEW